MGRDDTSGLRSSVSGLSVSSADGIDSRTVASSCPRDDSPPLACRRIDLRLLPRLQDRPLPHRDRRGRIGHPLRVQCGYCDSQHNYRGGPRIDPSPRTAAISSGRQRGRSRCRAIEVREYAPGDVATRVQTLRTFLLSANVKGPHRQCPCPTDPTISNCCCAASSARKPASPLSRQRRSGAAERMVLRPGTPGLQEKTWPIETFFHKVVMLRNRLRTLEQQVNASDLPDDVKVKLQGYVSGVLRVAHQLQPALRRRGRSVQGHGGD